MLFSYWQIVMFFLITYVGFWLPVQLSFMQTNPVFKFNTQTYLDIAVDILFLVDLILNFFTAYEKEQNGVLIFVTKPKLIAIQYLKGWFWVDFIALIPTAFIENVIGAHINANSKSQSLTKLVRILRIYRLFRIVRMAKIFKVFNSFNIGEKIDQLQLSSGLIRLIKVLLF